MADRSAPTLTAQQLATSRDIAAAAGMTIEARDVQQTLSRLRTVATAAAMLVALSVLAMTVGLIRSETAGDLRTRTAVGATSRTRRTLTGATAGERALLSAILGTTVAYDRSRQLVSRRPRCASGVPYLNLLGIVAVLPALAAIGGWLLAGREPPSIAQRPIE
jgi:putative ABC transport system permease protein